jgi:hypothetical protein
VVVVVVVLPPLPQATSIIPSTSSSEKNSMDRRDRCGDEATLGVM